MNEIKLDNKKPLRIHLPKNKKVLVGLGLGLGLLAVVAVSIYLLRPRSEENQIGVCSDTTLSESAPFIDDNKEAELVGTVQYIERQEGYETDVNCLYVLTKYYLGVTNPDESRKNYDLLVKVYSPDKGYSSALGVAQPPYRLLPQVKFVEEISKQSSGASLEEQEQLAP